MLNSVIAKICFASKLDICFKRKQKLITVICRNFESKEGFQLL